ncbi:hypothetical protein STEG23_003425, partial [Scotinomys teguina]
MKQPQMICDPKNSVPETLYLHKQTAVKIWLWAVICHCSTGLLFEISTEDVSFKIFTIFLVKTRKFLRSLLSGQLEQ